MNAAGALSTSREELLALAYSEAGAVVTKSITPESFLDPGASCGIENPGVAYYVSLLPELRRAGKPIITSVAGLTIEEFIVTAQTLAAAPAQTSSKSTSTSRMSMNISYRLLQQKILRGLLARFVKLSQLH